MRFHAALAAACLHGSFAAIPRRDDNTSLWVDYPDMAPLVGPPDRAPSLTRGCKRVYLDMGTNTGLKLAQLFEPEKHPRQQLVYNEYFGNSGNRSDVCALSFEPVPANAEKVRGLVSRLRTSGHAGARPSRLSCGFWRHCGWNDHFPP